MNSRQKAREAVVNVESGPGFAYRCSAAAFDSVLEDLDSDEMRDVFALAMPRMYAHDRDQIAACRGIATDVLAAIRAKLTEET